jgi:hypothetical protein
MKVMEGRMEKTEIQNPEATPRFMHEWNSVTTSREITEIGRISQQRQENIWT